MEIEGYAGGYTITQQATLTITVPDFEGNAYTMKLTDVLFDPLATVNLLSAKQLTKDGFGVLLLPGDGAKALSVPAKDYHPSPGIPLIEDQNVFYLMHTTEDTPAPGVAYHSYYNITLEELMHLRFNHAPVSRLAYLNGNVRGLPHPLKVSKNRLPCPHHTCEEANATHNNFPDPS